MNVIAGHAYFIVVDGYAAGSGAFSLSVTGPADGPTAAPTTTPLQTSTSIATPGAIAMGVVATPTATPVPASTIGTCSAPIVLPPTGGTFTGTTSGTGSLAGACASSSPAPEQVFAWTPTSSGVAILSTCSLATSYDSVLYVRHDSCAGTETACNDDTTGCLTGEPSTYHGSYVAMPVTAGQTYVIVVDGYSAARGTFSLTVVPPLP